MVIILTDARTRFGTGVVDSRVNLCPGSDYTAYERVTEGRLDGVTSGEGEAQLNKRSDSMCDEMKKQGMIVFTITFRLTDIPTKQLYERCATTPGHYFDSPTNGDLSVAFRAIGRQLSNLRLQM